MLLKTSWRPTTRAPRIPGTCSSRTSKGSTRSNTNLGLLKKVRTPAGQLIWPWDDSLRKPGTLGIGSDTHFLPKNHEKVRVPFKELYKTFSAFCKDYHSSSSDKKMKRHGYWHNPNKTWDWYSIGGRWTGFYPVKESTTPILGRPGAFGNKAEPGRADVVKVTDLDMISVMQEQHHRVEDFYKKYTRFLAGEKFPTFEGPREQAMTIGLLSVVQGPHTAGP